MFGMFLPKGAPFFELLTRQNEILCEVAGTLTALLELRPENDDLYRKITLLEEEADKIHSTIIKDLAQTFITPIDREDILHINQAQEEAIDMFQNVASRFYIFEFNQMRFSMRKLAQNAEAMLLLTNSMLDGLVHKKDSHDSKAFRALHSESGTLLSLGSGELYDLENPSPKELLNIIKWGQAYDRMENAVLKVVEVAEAIEEAVLKNV